MASRGYTSNGISHRQCGECRGAGGEFSRAHDPQDDYLTVCPVCRGNGYVRVTRVDVLEALQAERRNALRMRRQPADSLAAYLSPTSFRAYSDARRAAMRPSPLPTDIAPASALERAA